MRGGARGKGAWESGQAASAGSARVRRLVRATRAVIGLASEVSAREEAWRGGFNTHGAWRRVCGLFRMIF